MANVQRSSQYVHLPDPASLEGLDDFLCGLIDNLFEDQVKEEGEESEAENPLDELARIEQEIINEITEPVMDEDAGGIVSGEGGLFEKSVAVSANDKPSIFEADSELLNAHILRVKLLTSQLDYRNAELKESLRRIKWLETQLAEKDEQLKFLPELLKRAIDATSYEFELDDLKLKLEFLSSELQAANHQLDIIKSSWLGRLSMWLSSKREADVA